MSNLPEFPSPEQIESVGDQSATEAQQRIDLRFDDSEANVSYANILRLHTSPEEFAVDFAHVPNPALLKGQLLKVRDRVVLSPFNAKRLLNMLAQSVKRHEEQFGTIELDVGNRME
jgi:cell division ATPase FtsA